MARFSLRALLGFVAVAAVLSFGVALLIRKPPLRDQVLAALEADQCDYGAKVEFPKHRYQLTISDGCPSVRTIGLMAEWSKRSLHMKQPEGALRMVLIQSADLTDEAEKAMDAAFAHKWVTQGNTVIYSDIDVGVSQATKVQ